MKMEKDRSICESGLWSSYRDGELDPGKRADFEKHLNECDACRRNIRDTINITGIIQEGVNSAVSRTDFSSLEKAIFRFHRNGRFLNAL